MAHATSGTHSCLVWRTADLAKSKENNAGKTDWREQSNGSGRVREAVTLREGAHWPKRLFSTVMGNKLQYLLDGSISEGNILWKCHTENFSLLPSTESHLFLDCNTFVLCQDSYPTY